MSKRRKPYPPEFKEQIVNLYHNGSTVAELAEEFEPHRDTIKSWIRKAASDEEVVLGDGKESAEEENKRLRKELRRLQQERDILAKAAAWFARETNSIPKGSSNS